MNNREKARILADRLYPSTRKIEEFVEMLESELNRLDAPEPKKWEPRGGRYMVDLDGDARGHPIDQSGGRAYPCQADVERAAPLHRKLDRLVNWMVEHCEGEIEIDIDTAPFGSVIVVFAGTEEVGAQLWRKINSGEVEP